MSLTERIDVNIDPPLVRAQFSSVFTLLHEEIRLVFFISGHPFPSVFYHHNKQSLLEDHRVVIHTNGTVVIKNVHRSDAGDYTLLASNPGGNSSATIRLTVYCKTTLIIVNSLCCCMC